jgi:Secretion system C-terminal sorting domain
LEFPNGICTFVTVTVLVDCDLALVGCATQAFAVDIYVAISLPKKIDAISDLSAAITEKLFSNIAYTGGGNVDGPPMISFPGDDIDIKVFKFQKTINDPAATTMPMNIPFVFESNWFFGDVPWNMNILVHRPGSNEVDAPSLETWINVAEEDNEPKFIIENAEDFVLMNDEVIFEAPYFPIKGKRKLSEEPDLLAYLNSDIDGFHLNSLLLLPSIAGDPAVFTVDINCGMTNGDITLCKTLAWPGASFVIDNPGGVVMEMKNADISACTDAFAGITVKSGGILNLKNTFISDAHTAVELHRGAYLQVKSESKLYDNYNGILSDNNVGSASYPDDGGLLLSGVLEISRSTQLAPPYPNMPPVYGTLGGGVRLIDGLQLSDNDGFLRITGFNYGIHATRTSLNLNGSRINGVSGNGSITSAPMGRGIYMEGSGVETLKFTGLDPVVNNFFVTDIAVTAKNARVELKDLRARFVRRGIEVTNCRNQFVDISNNRIECNEDAITCTSNMPLQLGSQVANNTIEVTPNTDLIYSTALQFAESGFLVKKGMPAWKVDNNHVTFTQNITASKIRNGLSAYNAVYSEFNNNTILTPDFTGTRSFNGFQFRFMSDNIVRENTFRPVSGSGRSQQGFDVRNVSRADYSCNTAKHCTTGFSMSNMCDNSNLKGSEFDQTLLGLFLNDDVAIGPQGVDLPNEPATEDHGNQWLQLNAGQQAQHGAPFDADILKASQFEVDPAENPNFLPTNNGGLVWFTELASIDPSFANCMQGLSPGDIPGDRLDKAIASGAVAQYNWPGVTGAMFEKHLYCDLQEDAVKLNSAAMFSTFMQSKQGSSIARLYAIEAGIRSLAAYSSEENTAIANLRSDISGLETTLTANAPNSPNYPGLAAALAQKRQNLRNMLANLKSQKDADAQNLLVLNAQVPTSADWEINEKSVNALEIAYFLQGGFTAAQLAQLDSIASLCEQEHGEAVARARADYNMVEAKAFEPDCAKQREGQSSTITASFVGVRPNPAPGGSVLLDVPQGEYRVSIFNALGQQVQELATTTGALDISSLASGAYFLHVLQAGNGSRSIAKLIVQH